MPLWSKRLLLSLGSTLVFLLLAESAVRIGGLGPARWARTQHLESANKRHGVDMYPDDPRGSFDVDLRDPEVQRSLAAAGVAGVPARALAAPHGVLLRYTAELCRGPAIAERDPARQRIVLIGDSFTEGQGVPEADTFATRLAALEGGSEVINCGRRGLDFPELHTFFTRQLALEPDVVVYAMTLNDPEQSDEFRSRQEYLNDWIMDRRSMLGGDAPADPPWWTSRLLALAEERRQTAQVAAQTTLWYRQMVSDDNSAGWATTREHIAAMDGAMRARGGHFVVVLWPLFVELGEDYPFTEVHTTITTALGADGVAVHDSLPAFRGLDAVTLWVHPTDRHPNERAHLIFAEDVHRALGEAVPR